MSTPKDQPVPPRRLSRKITQAILGEATPHLNKKLHGHLPTGESLEDLEHTLVPQTIIVSKEVRQLTVVCVSAPEGGHLVPMLHVAMALARRKHKVQIVTLGQVGKKIESKCSNSGVIFEGVAPDAKLAESGEGEAAELMAEGALTAMFLYYSDAMRAPLQPVVERAKPDVVVTDFVTPCGWEVADLLGIPVVVNIPGPLAMRTMLAARRPGALAFALTQLKLCKPARGTDYPSLFSQRVCLWHTFFGLEDPEPVPPNFHVTGCTAPRTKGTGLQQTSSAEFNDWLQWARTNSMKVIYVTTGSMQILTKQQVQAFYHGLDRIPNVGIAWSMKEAPQAHLPGGGPESLPRKFFIRGWMPQAEALQVKEVALVITHCGWGGLNETINAGKPIVSAAFRFDQPLNAALAKRQGFAECLDMEHLTADAVQKAVNQVLEDPTYQENARKAQGLLLKSGGADRCVEVVEEVAEHGCEELVCQPPSVTEVVIKPACLRVGYFLAGVAFACIAPKVVPALRHALPAVRHAVHRFAVARTSI